LFESNASAHVCSHGCRSVVFLASGRIWIAELSCEYDGVVGHQLLLAGWVVFGTFREQVLQLETIDCRSLDDVFATPQL
jgi:hypothetical protein